MKTIVHLLIAALALTSAASAADNYGNTSAFPAATIDSTSRQPAIFAATDVGGVLYPLVLISGTSPVTLTGTGAVNVVNVTKGGGAIDSNTTRVTLATDGPGVAALNAIQAATSGTARTVTGLTLTGSGSISAGCRSVQLVFSSGFAGTVQGVSYAAGASLFFPALGADTYGSITYTVTSGSIFGYRTN